MAAPEHYDCKDCGASWSESKAKKCPYCMSKDINCTWNPRIKKWTKCVLSEDQLIEQQKRQKKAIIKLRGQRRRVKKEN